MAMIKSRRSRVIKPRRSRVIKPISIAKCSIPFSIIASICFIFISSRRINNNTPTTSMSIPLLRYDDDETAKQISATAAGIDPPSSTEPSQNIIIRSSISRQQLRFDDAGFPHPLVTISHSLPNAVPSHRTIPRHLAEYRLYHLSQRKNTSHTSVIRTKGKRFGSYDWNHHDYEKDHRPLYVFNPSIVHLNETFHGKEDYLTESQLAALTGGDDTVKYIAVFRASLGCNCFGTDDPNRLQMMNFQENLSYLAVALLNRDLQVVEDVLIDVNAGPGRQGDTYYQSRVPGQSREDCRIFLARQSVYVTCNDQIHRLSIQRRRTNSSRSREDNEDDDVVVNTTKYGTRDDHRIPYVYPNIYGRGLRITLRGYHGHLGKGKNFNVFKSLSSKNSNARVLATATETATTLLGRSPVLSTYYLQVYPIRHQYQQLRFPNEEEESAFPLHYDDPIMDAIHTAPPSNNDESSSLPTPSFDTPDVNNTVLLCPKKDDPDNNCSHPNEVPFFPSEGDHGGACCITLQLESEEGPSVLVGIAHQKTHRKSFQMEDKYRRYNNAAKQRFVSRLVAYRSIPPFDIVRISGWFCLGFFGSSHNSTGGNNGNGKIVEGSLGGQQHHNTLAGLNTRYKLDLYNDTFDCPIIHYVSGFTDHADDPEKKAVIAYGVNDCYSNMIVVWKDDIRKRLLFGK